MPFAAWTRFGISCESPAIDPDLGFRGCFLAEAENLRLHFGGKYDIINGNVDKTLLYMYKRVIKEISC